jgi:hypothetical protein
LRENLRKNNDVSVGHALFRRPFTGSLTKRVLPSNELRGRILRITLSPSQSPASLSRSSLPASTGDIGRVVRTADRASPNCLRLVSRAKPRAHQRSESYGQWGAGIGRTVHDLDTPSCILSATDSHNCSSQGHDARRLEGGFSPVNLEPPWFQ